MALELEVEQGVFFQVEDNIPMPPKRGGDGSKYDWNKLTKVGQSVFLPMHSRKMIYNSLSKYRERIEKADGTKLKHQTSKWQQKGADGKEVKGYRIWLMEINKQEVAA